MNIAKRLLILLLVSPALAQVKPAMTSFNAGEVSPLLLMRSDYAKYDNSCKKLQNMLVLSQGPVMRRPGTKYIAEVKDSADSVKLIPFVYSKTDAYILEWGDLYMRVYRNGGQIVEGTGTEDISDLNNVKAHWLLNDVSGTVVIDANGATHNGTATVDAGVLTTEGKVGTGCFDLDGQYAVVMTDHNDFSFTDDSNDSAFSIGCWAYVTEAGDIQNLLSKSRDDNATREWRFSVNASQKLQLHLADTSVDLASNRVAQWYLNEDANNTHVDDVSTNYDGVADANTEDFNATGKINGAFDFGASYAVEVNDHANLSFDDSGTKPFSIAAWIYVTDTAGEQRIITKFDSAAKGEWEFVLTAQEKIYLHLRDESADKYVVRITDDALSLGWRFVVVTYDSTGGATAGTGITFYVDGTLAASTTIIQDAGYVAMENLASKVAIGGVYLAGSLSNDFADKMDNIVLFKIELTAANVSALWNEGVGTESMGAAIVSAVANMALTVGWHFLACTYSAPTSDAANGIILYVDGAAVASTATNDASYTAMRNAAEEIRIGSQCNADDDANESFWRDKIDEVSIYSDVLTPTEVLSLYSTSTYEMTTTYTEDDVSELQYDQLADTMFIVHSDYKPRKLTRTGHTNWSIADIDYIDGPFKDENTTTTTVTPSATTGTIDIAASDDIFYPEHVGAIWEIRHPRTDATLNGILDANESSDPIDCEGDYKFITHGTWTGTVKLERTLDETTYETVYAINSADDTNIDYAGSEEESGYKYRVTMTGYSSTACTYSFIVYDHMHTGVVEITSYTDPNNVAAVVKTTLGGTSATTYWSEGYWSDRNGWPQTIAFHEFRLWYGGNTIYPQTIWSSRTDDFEKMQDGDLDSHALIYILPGQNPIQWMLSHTYLMIGTLGGAGRMGDPDEEMTPTTRPVYRHQTTDGSAYIQALLAGDAILYVEYGGRRVREFVYTLERDKFVSPDMTVLAEHITGDGINGIAFQSRPEKLLWSYREDGNFLSMSYNREQDVVAWSEHITDGDVESVAVIPGSDEDEVWFVVERVIDSNTVRYIEQMQPHDWGSDDNDTFFVDCGLTFDGGDSVTITDISDANPGVVTVATWPSDGDGTAIADGDQIKILAVGGMTDLNGNIYTIDDANVSGLNFSLNDSTDTNDVNTIPYEAYTTGGTAQRFENSFSSFDHLEGETLVVLGDGAALTDVTVSTSAFTTSAWANKVHAGLPYTSIIETMPITFVGQKGSVAADNKQISWVAMNFYESLGTKYGIEGDTDDVFTETSLVTGWKKPSFQHGFRTPDTTIYIEQVKPLPLILRAIVPKVTVYE